MATTTKTRAGWAIEYLGGERETCESLEAAARAAWRRQAGYATVSTDSVSVDLTDELDTDDEDAAVASVVALVALAETRG